MIQFCHIAPTASLERVTDHNRSHLILAHLVQDDLDYRNFYKNLQIDSDSELIMDNSGFEMFKRGEPMMDPELLIGLGHDCGATTLVMSDYPKEHYQKTIDAAIELIPRFKAKGFKTFFVPQSEVGDLDGYMKSLEWALRNPDIDYIGLSILGVPIAFGIEEKTFDSNYSTTHKMQRFLARWKLFTLIEEFLESNPELSHKRFHCLGMVDGPNEILLLSKYSKYIKSWDSSSAVWAAINGVEYDNSPTGLIDGKIESEVDFNVASFDEMPIDINRKLRHNIDVITQLIEET